MESAPLERAPWDISLPRKKRKPVVEEELPRAEENIIWCEQVLRIPEGKNVGKKLKMADFMKDDFHCDLQQPSRLDTPRDH